MTRADAWARFAASLFPEAVKSVPNPDPLNTGRELTKKERNAMVKLGCETAAKWADGLMAEYDQRFDERGTERK